MREQNIKSIKKDEEIGHTYLSKTYPNYFEFTNNYGPAVKRLNVLKAYNLELLGATKLIALILFPLIEKRE